ncbi:MAG: hypothetical protein EXS41_10580 [Opitutaceae bacterium]|nr:hypothetical protein [Opitutaceae bacterium]
MSSILFQVPGEPKDQVSQTRSGRSRSLLLKHFGHFGASHHSIASAALDRIERTIGRDAQPPEPRPIFGQHRHSAADRQPQRHSALDHHRVGRHS